MSQDLVYDVLVFNAGYGFDSPTATTTDLDIDIEDAFEALSPGHRGVTLGGGSGLGIAYSLCAQFAFIGSMTFVLSLPFRLQEHFGFSPGDIAWRMAVCGIGYGIFLSPNARGLISTNRLVGQALGGTLLAALLALGHGSDNTPAMIGTALAFLAGICSVARLTPANGRKHRP